MAADNDDIRVFLQEVGELVEALERGLMTLDASDRDAIHSLFRAAHTIKGNSAMIGASNTAHFMHAVEGVLSRMRGGLVPIDSHATDLLLPVVDVLRGLIDAIADGEPDPLPVGHEEVLAGLAELGPIDASEAEEASQPLEVERVFRLRVAIPEGEPAATLREILGELGAYGALTDGSAPLDDASTRDVRFTYRSTLRRGDIEGMVLFSNASLDFEPLADALPPATVADAPATTTTAHPQAATTPTPSPKARAATRAADVIKVDAARLDGLLDLVGEFAIALGASRRALASAAGTDSSEALETLDRLGAEVHERAMALRMVTVESTFERMRRPVHDAAKQLGKEITFVTEGVSTEIDRKLLDELADPLTHMVRNAVAHGIESADARARARKPKAGRVVLRASHRNGVAVIEVADDGGGIDPERVRRKAIERGLVAEGAALSERETYALLFAPGFSTAEAVNEVAGRGVGLDVVVKNVEKIRGRVEILSTLGKGTTFQIRLPLTLSVVEGMSVKVGRETVSIPLREVEELLDATSTVHTLEGRAEYIDVRGEMVPLVRLRELLGLADSGNASPHAEHARGDVVLVRSDRRRFGVAVDDVLGMGKTVLKSLDRAVRACRDGGATLQQSPGIGGATVLDDGSVGYVLDVHGVDAMAFG